MTPDTSAMQAAIDRDPDATAAFERFSRRLIGLARVHLGGRLLHKVDPEDVVQSVYKSLLVRYGESVIGAQAWEGLWGLLTLITIRKCADRARYYRADCRDLNREAWSGPESASSWLESAGREPTPDEALVLAETLEELLAELSGGEREIVELSLQGYSTQEISQQLGRAERSVRRIRERVRKHLVERQAEAAT